MENRPAQVHARTRREVSGVPHQLHISLSSQWRWLTRMLAVMIAVHAPLVGVPNSLFLQAGCLGSEGEQRLAEMSDSDDDSQSWHPRRRGVWRAMELPRPMALTQQHPPLQGCKPHQRLMSSQKPRVT